MEGTSMDAFLCGIGKKLGELWWSLSGFGRYNSSSHETTTSAHHLFFVSAWPFRPVFSQSEHASREQLFRLKTVALGSWTDAVLSLCLHQQKRVGVLLGAYYGESFRSTSCPSDSWAASLTWAQSMRLYGLQLSVLCVRVSKLSNVNTGAIERYLVHTSVADAATSSAGPEPIFFDTDRDRYRCVTTTDQLDILETWEDAAIIIAPPTLAVAVGVDVGVGVAVGGAVSIGGAVSVGGALASAVHPFVAHDGSVKDASASRESVGLLSPVLGAASRGGGGSGSSPALAAPAAAAAAAAGSGFSCFPSGTAAAAAAVAAAAPFLTSSHNAFLAACLPLARLPLLPVEKKR